MFWRNVYENEESLNDYLNGTDRTNYTYADGSIYRRLTGNVKVEAPCMMRKLITSETIHNQQADSANTVVDMQNRMKTIESKEYKVHSVSVRKKSLPPSSDRVLRSRKKRYSEYNIPFVTEASTIGVGRSAYKFGSLNTNTNNLGPDSESVVSGDEYIETDDSENTNRRIGNNFESTLRQISSDNNSSSSRLRSGNVWFQRNIYGLPSEDDDDETIPGCSGVISGDDQSDSDEVKWSNKTSRTKHVSKEVINSSNISNRLVSRSWSIFETITVIYNWILFVPAVVKKSVCNSAKWSQTYCNTNKWYIIPFYLPFVICTNIAYRISRLFGLPVHFMSILFGDDTDRYPWWKYFLRIFIWTIIVFFILHLLFERSDSEAMYFRLFSVPLNVSDSLLSGWQYVVSLLPYTVGLISGIRGPVSNNLHVRGSLNVSQLGNQSDYKEIIETLQEKVRSQEHLITNFHDEFLHIKEKIVELNSYEKTITSVSQLKKQLDDFTVKMSTLEQEMQRITSFKQNIDYSYEELKNDRNKDKQLISSISDLKSFVDAANISIYRLIEKVDRSADSNFVHNLSKVLEELRLNLSSMGEDMLKMESRISDVEVVSKVLKNNSETLKEEIISDINIKIEEFKNEQSALVMKLHQEMSRLEMGLNDVKTKSIDNSEIEHIIQNHFEKLKQELKDELNSSLWNDFSNFAKTLVQNIGIHSNNDDQVTSTSFLSKIGAYVHSSHFNSDPSTSNTCVRLEDIRKMLTDALNLFAADRIGIADYALESAGGTISTIRCTETYTERAATLTLFGIPILRLTNSPRTIIQPSFHPGECWAMKGSKGTVVVQLSGHVNITAVSIDHIPKSISPSGNIDSAIKNFEIKVLRDETDVNGVSIGNFTYQIDGNPVQTFTIQEPKASDFVELVINSNYGNPEYTCIYRFRVHGTLIKF